MLILLLAITIASLLVLQIASIDESSLNIILNDDLIKDLMQTPGKIRKKRKPRSAKSEPKVVINGTAYNEEWHVIELGKADYNSKRKLRKPMLCVSFIKGKPDPLKILQNNMETMGTHCEWAVVFYDGIESDIRNFCRPSSSVRVTSPSDFTMSLKDNSTTIVHCQRAPETVNRPVTVISAGDGSYIEQKLSVPKSALYNELLALLPFYEKVFVMDEDISLEGFDADNFLRVWKCVFSDANRPLIVQPLIVERTQYFPYVHLDVWKRSRRKIYASGVGLVEQQVPAFDAAFLEWLVRRVFSQTRTIALQKGVDQSLDRTWCQAAVMYGREVLHLNYSAGTHACAVIVGGSAFTAVHHLNTRSLENKRVNRGAYREKAADVHARYVELFPSWVQRDIRGAVSPLDRKHGGQYRKYTRFGTRCEKK